MSYDNKTCTYIKIKSIKNDNTEINKKRSLRQQATGHLNCLKVLDLFAGNNKLWQTFELSRYYGVEMDILSLENKVKNGRIKKN